jgi:hypothetical protein
MNWITRAKENAEKLANYTTDLEAKNEHLRQELQMIAAGFYLAKHKNTTDKFDSQLRLRAAEAIGTEAKMQNRKCDKWVF